jgi:hypothetical protein
MAKRPKIATIVRAVATGLTISAPYIIHVCHWWARRQVPRLPERLRPQQQREPATAELPRREPVGVSTALASVWTASAAMRTASGAASHVFELTGKRLAGPPLHGIVAGSSNACNIFILWCTAGCTQRTVAAAVAADAALRTSHSGSPIYGLPIYRLSSCLGR